VDRGRAGPCRPAWPRCSRNDNHRRGGNAESDRPNAHQCRASKQRLGLNSVRTITSCIARVESQAGRCGLATCRVPTRFLKSWILAALPDRVLALWKAERDRHRAIEMVVRGTRARQAASADEKAGSCSSRRRRRGVALLPATKCSAERRGRLALAGRAALHVRDLREGAPNRVASAARKTCVRIAGRQDQPVQPAQSTPGRPRQDAFLHAHARRAPCGAGRRLAI